MQKRKNTLIKNMTALLLSLMMVLTLIPGSETTAEAAIATDPVSNPVISEDSSKTTWDCVWFGSYPQKEIVKSISDCGTYGTSYFDESDYIVDAELYDALNKASGWVNGDITLDGIKYRRLTKPSTYTVSDYAWDSNVHYFRYEPIKWRVLKVDGNQALLLSDIILDYQCYNDNYINVTWETCMTRDWLNAYDGFSNDQNFKDSAFTEEELTVLLDTELDNVTSGTYSPQYGGNDTTDKVFLLSEYDAKSGNYGFTGNESRCCCSTIYAIAKGEGVYDSNYGRWGLRSHYTYRDVYDVEYFGGVYTMAVNSRFGIRPAVSLDLTSLVWSNAGTVCTDGTVNETEYVYRNVCKNGHIWVTEPGTAATCTEDGTTEATVCSRCGDIKLEHKVVKKFGHSETKALTKAATTASDGVTAGYYCSICNKVFEGMEVIPQIEKAALSFDKADYDGEEKSPEVTVFDREGTQLVENEDYTVSVPEGRTNAGTYQYTVTFMGDYSGSTKLTLTIKGLGSASNKASLSYTTATYDGKTKSPTLKVTDSNGKTLTKNTDYTVSVPSGRKNVGVYTYKITYTGKYEKATKNLTLTINPKGTTISKLTALTKAFKVTWKKYSTQTSGYQLQYSTSSAFKSAKTVTVSGTSTTAKTIKSLKAKTKYYVRIRTYKKVSGKTYYSAWSAKKYVKTK